MSRRKYKQAPRRPGPVQRMNVYIMQDSWNKADQMAGDFSLGAFIDELIQREHRRRENWCKKNLDALNCTENGAHSTGA